MSKPLTTAAAINAFWGELSDDIPDGVKGDLALAVTKEAVTGGICVEESADA